MKATQILASHFPTEFLTGKSGKAQGHRRKSQLFHSGGHMYEFPPPVWQYQQFTGIGIFWIVALGIVAPLAIARVSKPTRKWVVPWAFVATIAAWTLGFWLPDFKTYDPVRYKILLPFSLFGISVAVIVRMWWTSKSDRGLVESTMLIALFLFILSAVISPAGVIHPRSAYWRTQCKNNLKQIGLGLYNYSDVYSTFPPAQLGRPASSWRIALLPYIDEEAVAGLYDLTQTWDSAANEPLQRKQVRSYSCPGRPMSFDSAGRYFTSYVVPTGEETIFSSQQATPFSAIKDGTSNTLLVVEACGTEIIWTKPEDVEVNSYELSVNGRGSRNGLSDSLISSWHKGGAHALLADGSARFLSDAIDPKILRSLLTKDAADDAGEW